MLFAPMQISVPGPVASVWFTITEPKAPNGQGEPVTSRRAALALRIQWARVSDGMEFIVRPCLAIGVCKWAAARAKSGRIERKRCMLSIAMAKE
jgi:hypothetical protein